MSKAIIWSDLHIHSHKNNTNRAQDCIQVLSWVLEEAKKNECTDVIFLGDLFHERSKIDIQNYLMAFEAFLNFSYECPHIKVWMIVGNHDMYHKERWDVNSIKPFNAIPNVTIIDKPTTVKIDDLLVDFLPHVENPFAELAKLKEGRHPSSLRLLLSHLSVDGASLHGLFSSQSDVIVEYDDHMVRVDADAFDDWERTFLGHYHGAQKLNDKVEYVGSPLQLSFSEAFQQKHIILFDFKTFKQKYIVNEFSPQHFILAPDEIAAYDLSGHFVRIQVDRVISQDMVDIRNDLIDKKAASVTFQVKDRKKEDVEQIEQACSILQNIEDMIEEYVKTTGVPAGMDSKLLIEIGQKIAKEIKE